MTYWGLQMIMRSYLILVGFIWAGPVAAETLDRQSNIILPVSLNLAAVQDRLNQEIPQRLHTIDESRVCVPAKWIKVNLFVGTVKTKVTPDIDCSLSGSIDRNGPISLGGQGGALFVSFPVKASVTARGRGDIGKNIRQTVDAAMTLQIAATPTISPDWKPGLTVDHAIKWDQRPTIKLFNLIDITITDKVEPKLQDAINKQKEKIPALLDKLHLRETIDKAWTELQKPQRLNANPAVWLAYEPSSIGFSGINIQNNVLEARLQAAGKTRVGLDEPKNRTLISLSPLSTVAANQSGFSIALPISASFVALEAIANPKLRDRGPIAIGEGGSVGELTLSNLKLSREDGRLVATLDAMLDTNKGWLDALDVFHWFDVKGTVKLGAKPVVNDAAKELSIEGFDFHADTNRGVADALVAALRIEPVRDFLSKLVRYGYGKDVETAMIEANKLMKRDLGEGFALDGALTKVAIEQPAIEQTGVVIPIALEGSASVKLGLN